MEKTGDTGSDRDKTMMNSFESFGDKSEKKETKDKKKKSSSGPVLFAKESEEAKPEYRSNIFESKAEKTTTGESENSLLDALTERQAEGELTADESKLVGLEDIEQALPELAAELQEADGDERAEAPALASVAFYENLKDGIGDAELLDETLLDEVADRTAEELELTDAEAEPVADGTEDDDPRLSTQRASGRSSGPPRPPVPPTFPTSAGATPPLPPIPVIVAAGGNMAPQSSLAAGGNTPATHPNVLTRRKRRADLLVGGVLGYMIGRRRGRIKTEARMQPVQDKLTAEVKTLHAQIAEREDRIRRLAIRKAIEAPETIAPKIVEKLQARREQSVVQPEQAADRSAESALAPERLARVLIPKPEIIERPKTVETLTVPELLNIADKIEVQGTTLRRMYEVGRIDAIGLRRVVKEYLHNRNDSKYEKRLFENLKPVESNPEFLPKEQAVAQDSGISGAGALDVAAIVQTPAVAVLQPVATAAGSIADHTAQKQKSHQQQTAIVAIIVIMLGLGLLFVLLR